MTLFGLSVTKTRRFEQQDRTMNHHIGRDWFGRAKVSESQGQELRYCTIGSTTTRWPGSRSRSIDITFFSEIVFGTSITPSVNYCSSVYNVMEESRQPETPAKKISNNIYCLYEPLVQDIHVANGTQKHTSEQCSHHFLSPRQTHDHLYNLLHSELTLTSEADAS